MAVGSGSDLRDLEACGVPTQERGKRLDEGIQILRRLWTESNVTHHGQFYQFENVTIEPKPRKGSLDIWIGGKSDAILKRVVRLGDGWFPALTSPAEFKRDMEKLMAFGEEAGRKVNPRESGVLCSPTWKRTQTPPGKRSRRSSVDSTCLRKKWPLAASLARRKNVSRACRILLKQVA